MSKSNKYVRWSMTAAGIIVLYAAFSWFYTNLVIMNARADGIYPSAEAGMQALMDRYYPSERRVKIIYAGPNDNNGNRPYVWYVIAEVHATARADGSETGQNGCDSPGTFFLQLKDGNWVHVSEGFFTTFMTSWLRTFDLAGSGQKTPSTNLLQGAPLQFCQ